MALITRLSRLFVADAHAVIDHLEAPDVLLRQALREMQDAIYATEVQGERLRLDLETHARNAKRHQAAIEQCNEALALCLDANDDDLARSTLRRMALEEKRLSKNEAQRALLTQTLEQQRAALDEQRQQLAEMQDRAALFEVEVQTQPDRSYEEPVVSPDEIEVALLAAKAARAEQQR